MLLRIKRTAMTVPGVCCSIAAANVPLRAPLAVIAYGMGPSTMFAVT